MSAQVDNMLKALSHASGLFISTGYVLGQSSAFLGKAFCNRVITTLFICVKDAHTTYIVLLDQNKGYTKS